MPEPTNNKAPGTPQQKYVWPWFVWGAVLLGIALSVLWLSHEIERTRRIRDLNAPAPQSSTNVSGHLHREQSFMTLSSQSMSRPGF